jgi:hypothetical protein
MKYYETSYEDYLKSNNLLNAHPELTDQIGKLPRTPRNFENMILYGPSGIGKYTQCLKIIEKYSPSNLKYDKKITASTDKQTYVYRVSDIHYEIDMSLLGCNSKTLWHEIFFQIADVVSVKTDKMGIIVCKNFHTINNELLEVFYSYMHHFNDINSIMIKFIIMSEQISFIPSQIIDNCYLMNIKRPSTEIYNEINKFNYLTVETNDSNQYLDKVSKCHPNNITNKRPKATPVMELNVEGIMNMKEMRWFPMVENVEDLPKDIFNIVCDGLIEDMKNPELKFTSFRDTLYDILTYDINIFECIWYILCEFIGNDNIHDVNASDVLVRLYPFFKQYNNNYRPIYHLESIMFYIISKLEK